MREVKVYLWLIIEKLVHMGKLELNISNLFKMPLIFGINLNL